MLSGDTAQTNKSPSIKGNDLLNEEQGLSFKTKAELNGVLGNETHPEYFSVDEVMMHLALCHTVVIDKKKGTYNSSSPDEIALLEGVKAQGYVFKGIRDGLTVIECPDGSERRFKTLNVLEFNSTRKRMSIVV